MVQQVVDKAMGSEGEMVEVGLLYQSWLVKAMWSHSFGSEEE
jgi:hypothetical protein